MKPTNLPNKSEVDRRIVGYFDQLYSATIFGGYLRDTLIGVAPTDLDVSFGSKLNAEDSIIKLGLILGDLGMCLEKNSSSAIGYTNYRVTSQGMSFKHIDISVCLEEINQDVDINMLMLNNRKLSLRSDGNLLEVLQNLQRREFKAFDGCPEARINKMVGKGFALIDDQKGAWARGWDDLVNRQKKFEEEILAKQRLEGPVIDED